MICNYIDLAWTLAYFQMHLVQPRKIWGDACQIVVGRESGQDTWTVLVIEKNRAATVAFQSLEVLLSWIVFLSGFSILVKPLSIDIWMGVPPPAPRDVQRDEWAQSFLCSWSKRIRMGLVGGVGVIVLIFVIYYVYWWMKSISCIWISVHAKSKLKDVYVNTRWRICSLLSFAVPATLQRQSIASKWSVFL